MPIISLNPDQVSVRAIAHSHASTVAQMHKHTMAQTHYKHTMAQTHYKHTMAQTHHGTNAQAHKHTMAQTHKHTKAQTHKHTMVQMHKHTLTSVKVEITFPEIEQNADNRNTQIGIIVKLKTP